MSNRLVLALIVLVVGVPIAYFMDRNSWRKRSSESLKDILRKKDWGRSGAALKELRRRGEDIAPFIPVVLELMTTDSASVRTAGKIILKDHFAEIAREIPKFSPTADEATRTALLAPLLERYGVKKNG